MKRLIIFAALALAAVGVAAAAASADDYWLHSTTSTQQLCVAYPGGVQSGDVIVGWYANPGCNSTNIGNGNLNSVHYVEVDRSVTTTNCTTVSEGADSGPYTDETCTELVTPPEPVTPSSATSPPRGPNNFFLCYSTFQTVPGVWSEAEAKALLAQGYWQAYAVKGTVPGGTNIGGYHLVCNLAGTQAVSPDFAGGAGETVGKGYVGDNIGYYSVIGG